jgi:hypothetical protein
MISLIKAIVILGLIYWAVSLIPLPDPFPTIVKILFIIAAVVIVLQAFGISTGLPQIR